MTSPRTPRQWNAGDPEPGPEVQLLRFQRDLPHPYLRRSLATDEGGLGGWTLETEPNPASWSKSLARTWGHRTAQTDLWGPLVEVLPETPEPPQEGSYFDRTSFADEEAEAARAALVPVPASRSVPAVPESSTGGKETGEAAETATEELRDALADLLDAAMERNQGASLDSIEAWDFDTDLLPIADAILAAGWRPPLPKMDVYSLRSQVGALIDELAFHDDDRDKAHEVAQALIDGGWLDRSGAFGSPEPVAHTLRRVIQDLENEAMFRDPMPMIGAYSERSAEDVIGARVLSEYAERLRKHPSLTGEVTS